MWGNDKDRRGRYLSPGEVAGELRISEKTAQRMCRDQELPAVKLGNRWFVPEREFRIRMSAGGVILEED